MHMPHVLLVELDFHPERRVVRDLEHGHAGAELHAVQGVAHLRHHEAGGGGQEGQGSGSLAGGGQRGDLRFGDVPVTQPLAGGLEQRLGPAHRVRVRPAFPQPLEVIHGGEVLLLGGDEFRAVDFEQHVALLHGLADVVDRRSLDPAFELGVDRNDLLVVVGEDADGANRPPQVAPFDCGGAHREVLQELLADAHGAAGWALFGAAGVNRDEIHPHGRLARLVGTVVGIHGRSPIEDPALPGCVLLGALARPSG